MGGRSGGGVVQGIVEERVSTSEAGDKIGGFNHGVEVGLRFREEERGRERRIRIGYVFKQVRWSRAGKRSVLLRGVGETAAILRINCRKGTEGGQRTFGRSAGLGRP
jgi:hypothetical protein